MTEPAAGPSGPGTVVIEVGAGLGALVLYTPAGLDGAEIEISRDGAESENSRDGADGENSRDGRPAARRTHSRVRPRHTPAGTSYAAVYPGLPAGRYTIWRDEREPAAAVTIADGQVTSCRWPG